MPIFAMLIVSAVLYVVTVLYSSGHENVAIGIAAAWIILAAAFSET